ncbi:MAG: hypothetical protein ABIQ18_04405, partial [Umezawaea sp.]
AYERALGVQGLGENVNRRELLAAVAAVTAGTAASEPLARLLDGLALPEVPRQVGMAEVAAVQQATSVYTSMDLRYGGVVAADVSSGALRWAVKLLDASMPDDTRAELSAAVGALADRTAWTHHDSGHSYSARRLSTLALRTADQGNDPDLRAHVILNMASQIGEAQPAEAARLVDVALSDGRVCTLERANLHAVRARHLANAGEVREALDHITTAERLLGQDGEAPQWASFLTTAHLDKLITEALTAAGENQEATHRFEMILPRFGQDRLRGKAGMMTSLATLYVADGRVDEAIDLAQQAGAALDTVRSGRASGGLVKLNKLIRTATKA